ncbi:hypothetical protein A0130_03195 [Leifsonia xyli]|uniref:hypothetical protein n=1 Tax=Leifsonia xyli TaxID=1575 RepID=UPI0007CDA282|nr:hypothetical protein A0130_03195 [Leifsonia xyli]
MSDEKLFAVLVGGVESGVELVALPPTEDESPTRIRVVRTGERAEWMETFARSEVGRAGLIEYDLVDTSSLP